MIQHCRACLVEVDCWFHATGLLCTKCSAEYQALIRRWEKKYRKQMDYVPFSVWSNFVRKKNKEIREQQDKDST